MFRKVRYQETNIIFCKLAMLLAIKYIIAPDKHLVALNLINVSMFDKIVQRVHTNLR